MFCRKNDEVRQLIDAAVGAAPVHVGRGQSGDNVTPKRGSSPTYALRRLKRDRPDLANKVVRGEMSAHAAAIEAGFRKKPTPLDLLWQAWAKASEQERAVFRDEIVLQQRVDHDDDDDRTRSLIG